MIWFAPLEKNTATDELEKRFWDAAEQFRANSSLKPQEYSLPILGLIYCDHPRDTTGRFDWGNDRWLAATMSLSR
jgi:hypothetical protein